MNLVTISQASDILLFPLPRPHSYILQKDSTKGLNFPYPVFITTWHMAFATFGTRLLARFTHLLDGLKDVEMTKERWYRNILPIGALFSASLIFSNVAYLTLSVPFIQMLKVSLPKTLASRQKEELKRFKHLTDQNLLCFSHSSFL